MPGRSSDDFWASAVLGVCTSLRVLSSGSQLYCDEDGLASSAAVSAGFCTLILFSYCTKLTWTIPSPVDLEVTHLWAPADELMSGSWKSCELAHMPELQLFCDSWDVSGYLWVLQLLLICEKFNFLCRYFYDLVKRHKSTAWWKAPWRTEAAAAPRTDMVSHQAHSTPASSLWLQLCAPQSRLLQSIIVISLPLQFTSSSQIGPVPLENQSSKQTNKKVLDERKKNKHFF